MRARLSAEAADRVRGRLAMKDVVRVVAVAGGMALLVAQHGAVAGEVAEPDFDATFSLTAASDYFDDGLTQSNNHAVIQPMLEVYYGAFYGSVGASNVDYGKGEDADAEVELIAGVAPTVGAWTFDLNVTSYQYPGEESDAYTYVFGSATRDFGNGLSLGAGYGYYWYESGDEYNELWVVGDYAFDSGLSFHAEASYDIDYDRAGNDYLGVEGGVVVPLPLGFEASANLGYEDYFTDPATPSYLWYNAGVAYALTEWASLDVRYHGNTLSRTDCAVYTATNCLGRVVASLTVSQSLSALRSRAEPEQPVQPERPLAER
jgi:hypothetical protein